MKRKVVGAIALVAVGILLPLGRWVIASRQDAADAATSRNVERGFASRQMPVPGGGRLPAGDQQWQRGPGGPGGPGGQGGPRGQRGARMMEQMAKEVGLNPTQVKQIQAIRDSSRPLMSDIRRNPQLSREQKMAQTQQIRQAQLAQISKILSPDQQAKYTAFEQKMQAARQARRGQNGGGSWPGGGPGAGGPGSAN